MSYFLIVFFFCNVGYRIQRAAREGVGAPARAASGALRAVCSSSFREGALGGGLPRLRGIHSPALELTCQHLWNLKEGGRAGEGQRRGGGQKGGLEAERVKRRWILVGFREKYEFVELCKRSRDHFA